MEKDTTVKNQNTGEPVQTRINSLFFDIDGTLTSFQTNDVPQSTRNAIAYCRSKGIKVAIATGRSPHEFDGVRDTLHIDFDAVVCMTGQVVYDQQTIYHQEPLSRQSVDALLAYLTVNPDISVNFSEREYGYLNQMSSAVRHLYDHLGKTAPHVVYDDPFSRLKNHDLYQFSMFVTPEIEKEVVQAVPGVRSLRWHPDFADFIPADGGKDKGIAALLDAWGLDRRGCLVFGDGENDIDMLDFAGISVAMGNASDLVKAHADYVTSSVDQDGVMNALRHLGLVE
ncbi:cof family hydrolase [Scardovia inopinata]|uniref:Cof-like hydrolase n=1 Tax=Scardovia inopinata F0304 TaxID=641146 RepID=W5IJU7_SCAIO|nr:Cof-type HAD-IIB family hydrolase [Scardovia inopinata]EFG27298.1 cof-like hydrolase [Scardovia inopinata F0304]BAR06911.1 putative hydrolase [Scardovia inopinata JCM 12537]SUV50975.1 cof family hydrolase [Scardovia inopinata]